MRGSDECSGALFSYVDLEARVPPRHPLRTIRAVVNAALAGLSPGFHEFYARIGRPSIPPEQLLRGSCCRRSTRSGRSASSWSDWTSISCFAGSSGWDRRPGVEPFDLLEEPGSPARGRYRHRIPGPGARSAAGPPPAVERALQRRWQPGRGVGVDEELSTQGQAGRPAERRPQRHARLPRRAAHQRQPRRHDRSRCPAVPQGPGPGGEALLRRACADGEPARPRGRCRADPRLRPRRAARGAGHARPAADGRPDDACCRPRLRRQGLYPGAAGAPGDPAHRPEHQWPALGDRSPDHGHPGYGASQRVRKRIEEAFGWITTIAGQARTKLRGLARVRWSFTLAAAAYNLVRLPRLLAGSAG